MKLLYIEDEMTKSQQVTDIISEYSIFEVKVCRSYNSAIRNLHRDSYDLVLLDMSLPLYDSLEFGVNENEFETYAGVDIMIEIDRMNLGCKVIVITAFDVLGENDNRKTLKQLNVEIENNFGNIYLGYIYFNSSSLEWVDRLKELIENFLKEGE